MAHVDRWSTCKPPKVCEKITTWHLGPFFLCVTLSPQCKPQRTLYSEDRVLVVACRVPPKNTGLRCKLCASGITADSRI